ncbi:sigma-70 family RNA polymerase sigma factor [Pyxidicoccus xibeiensis]|uniref:sigma-70 family RNA polymerase sigma factor n=1 Tax=Pyxidicoccus xibeiensis TaxID=2906759 RepID=UPI0020A80624|nr:sigma-70 family RNA polymerase sigma factor [Pyxidicoccus xibeiensis]MCP3142823.1 sigma-70 family RNA polymerase sigma factor [Pyxidicoccus xibeiensis]
MEGRLSLARRVEAFESCRHELVALSYRMLGDLGRAEDMVQEAWLRWQGHEGDVESSRAFLVTVVTRLCLNELGSARARREEARPDRLPEPVDLDDGGIARVERVEQVSMAFLVALQRLTPAERAVLLLHEVFDFGHQEIAELVGNTAAACRKLLERARRSLATERRMQAASQEEHRRLLAAFLQAASGGDVQGIVRLLAEDAVMVTDGGSEGRRFAGQRNLSQPLRNAVRIAAFVVATTRRTASALRVEERQLNAQPAAVFWNGDQPFAALLLAVADGKVQRVYFHADLRRLGHLGRPVDA